VKQFLRKYFNATLIYNDRRGVYLSGFFKFDPDINKANMYFFSPIRTFILVKYLNAFGGGSFRLRKVWMPSVKIDGSVKTYLLKGMKSDD